jgi:hypothetical protein
MLASKKTVAFRRQGQGPASTSTPNHLKQAQSDWIELTPGQEVSEPNLKLFCVRWQGSIEFHELFINL